jgi:hypothetical protein
MAQDNLDPNPVDEAVEPLESTPESLTDPPGGGGGTGGIATPTAAVPTAMTDPPGGSGGTGG